MNAEHITIYKEVFSYCIFNNIHKTLKFLTLLPHFEKFDDSQWAIVQKELLLFEIHLCDRMFFSWFGNNKIRDNLFYKLVLEIGSALNSTIEGFLTDNLDILGKIDTDGFSAFLGSLKDNNIISSECILKEYNDRTHEYANYKYDIEPNEGYKNWLFWEFGKKVASLLNCERDASIIVAIQSMVLKDAGVLIKVKKLLDIKLKGNKIE